MTIQHTSIYKYVLNTSLLEGVCFENTRKYFAHLSESRMIKRY